MPVHDKNLSIILLSRAFQNGFNLILCFSLYSIFPCVIAVDFSSIAETDTFSVLDFFDFSDRYRSARFNLCFDFFKSHLIHPIL